MVGGFVPVSGYRFCGKVFKEGGRKVILTYLVRVGGEVDFLRKIVEEIGIVRGRG